ncbi:MAG: GxxExxY protein [Ignavibacteriaceae bacterium]
MIYQELSNKIIGSAIEVHKQFGSGLLESAYEECLAYELIQAGLNIERQKPIPVVYKEVKLECGYRADIVVENTIIIELKAIDALTTIHEAIVLTYLKFAHKKLGLLMNFNVTRLKDGLKRYVL